MKHHVLLFVSLVTLGLSLNQLTISYFQPQAGEALAVFALFICAGMIYLWLKWDIFKFGVHEITK